MKPWPLLLILAGCLSLQAHGSSSGGRVLIPAYGPSYSTDQGLLVEIRDELRGLRQDVQRLSAGQASQPQQDALGVVAKRCLPCHQSPADKGDGFVIVGTDGVLVDLSPGYRAAIARKTRKGEMPPQGKLPEAEVKLIADYFSKEQK